MLKQNVNLCLLLEKYITSHPKIFNIQSSVRTPKVSCALSKNPICHRCDLNRQPLAQQL